MQINECVRQAKKRYNRVKKKKSKIDHSNFSPEIFNFAKFRKYGYIYISIKTSLTLITNIEFFFGAEVNKPRMSNKKEV